MKINIYHGSEKVISVPQFGYGSNSNDYGRGFYCTENLELAKEWACKKNQNGFANCYSLEMDGLAVCNLNQEPYHILNWLAVLTKYRSYWQKASIAEDAKAYLQDNFYVDVSKYDIIIGYRADDSYFSFVQDFIMGTISLEKLSRAMRLGKLGEQIVLKSEKAFSQIEYLNSEAAFAQIYYAKKAERGIKARREYALEKSVHSRLEETYILDLMRGRVNMNELRL